MPRRGADAVVPGSPLSRTSAQVFDRPKFEYKLRTEAESVMAFPPIPLAVPDYGDEANDTEKSEAWRRELGRRLGDRKVSGKATTPWLNPLIDLSSRVLSVEGVGLSTSRRSDVDPVYPQVVAVTHKLTFPQSTSMTFGDFRHEPEIAEGGES